MVSNTKLFFILCLMFILIGTSLNRRDARIKALENQLVEVKEEIAKTNEDNKKLHAYLTELEASDSIDKEEIMLMWHSIGIMRGNFVALGLGFHLKEKDICPEEECPEEEYEDWEDWEEG
jgi:hypothetical protein